LDVKATADQKDPKGAEPIDIAKEFVDALLNDDRVKVEEMVGYSKSLLNFIYSDSKALQRAKEVAKYIDPNSWKSTRNPMGSFKVQAVSKSKQYGEIPITIEIMYVTGDASGRGRMLYVSNLY
jgi:hypothetical protein